MKLHSAIAGLAILAFLASCNSANTNKKAPSATGNQNCTTPATPPAEFPEINNFGFRFYASMVTTRVANGNLVVSPLSAALAIGLAHSAAMAETRQEITYALGLSAYTDAQILDKMAKLIDDSQRCSLDVASVVANSVWAPSLGQIKADYINEVKQYYDAEVSSPITPEAVNKWVSDKTNGRIPKLLEQVDPDILFMLVNAIYFKGTWTYPFDAARTREGPFTRENSTKINVNYMVKPGSAYQPYEAFSDNQVIAIRLPFGKSKEATLSFVMPVSESTFQIFATTFTAQQWSFYKTKFRSEALDLYVPKFTIRSPRMNLIPSLDGLGMHRVFRPGAQLGNSSDYADRIYEALQMTFFEVNEKGAEAAAATSMSFENYSASEPRPYIINQPFILILEDSKTGVASFVGAIGNPVVEE